MSFRTIFLSILFLLLFPACASVVRLPISTGQVPEVSGELWGGRVGLDLSNATPVTVINDITTSPVTRNEIKVGANDDIISSALGLDSLAGSRFELALGLLKRLEIYYTNSFGARYMFWGEPGKVGWRGTAFLGYYAGTNTSSTTLSSTTYEVKTQTSGGEYGVSLGKRFSDKSLGYLTLASRGGDTNIRILQNSVQTETYKDRFSHYISTLGFMFGSTWFLKLEASMSFIDWKASDSTGAALNDSGNDFGGTFGFGYRW